jgi:general secretion pathway protein F
MIFHYKALDKKSKVMMGDVEAASASQAKQNLRTMGLFVTSLLESREGLNETISSAKKKGLFAKLQASIVRVSSRDRAMFARQLGTLLKAGMELATSLGDIAEQTENENFRRIIWDLRERIQEGAQLSRAMSLYPRVFSDIFVYMIRAGESLGRQDEILLRLADLEEKGNKLKNKVQTAMMYPAFLVVMMVIVMSVLMSKVVPEIIKVFSQSRALLPFPTRVVIFISNIMSNYWPVIFFSLGLIIYIIYRYLNTETGRSRWDYIKLHNGLTRVLYGKILASRFSRNLGMLLRSKVDLLDSLDIVKKIVKNIHVENSIDATKEDVKSGGSLARSLSQKSILPKMVVGMIAAGEASDQLDEMLLKIAEVYEEEVETSVQALMSLLEPVIIVILALSVGFVVMSIIMPITQMNQLIK